MSACRRSFPDLNNTRLLAGTDSSWPVRGFRALGFGFVCLAIHVPNPRISTLSADVMASLNASKNAFTHCPAKS